MQRRFQFTLLTSFVFCAWTAFGADQASSPIVSFVFDFPNSNPGHYEITLTKDGHGSYSSNGQLSRDSQPGDPEALQFAISDEVRKQVFDLAQRAHYFSGKIDSGRKEIANTGVKTLTYKDGAKVTSATYNYSPLAPVEQLTDIFQNLSTTLEFGRRLKFFHKYQKLALDEELKKIDELRRDGGLGDIEAITPVLNEIANDPTVMNVSRARALRLLALQSK